MSQDNTAQSTDGAAFKAFAERALSDRGQLVVVLRYANAAGCKNHFLVKNWNELAAARSCAAPMDSLSMFPIRDNLIGQAGPSLLSLAAAELGRLHTEYGNDAVLDIVKLDPADTKLATDEIDFVQTADELRQWMVDNLGQRVAVVFLDVDDGEAMTAYVPGPDGVVRLGAY